MAEEAAAAKREKTGYGAAAVGIVLGLCGLWLAGGGAWLLWLGGSPYYVLAGLGCLIAAGFYLRGRAGRGLAAYLAVFGLTCVWALSEVGANAWLLWPRVGGPAVIAVLAILHGLFAARRRAPAWSLLAVGAVALAGGLYLAKRLPTPEGGTLAGPLAPAAGQDWTAFGQGPEATAVHLAPRVAQADGGARIDVADYPGAGGHVCPCRGRAGGVERSGSCLRTTASPSAIPDQRGRA